MNLDERHAVIEKGLKKAKTVARLQCGRNPFVRVLCEQEYVAIEALGIRLRIDSRC